MKQEIKDLWVAALRSGEYPQTMGALQRTVESYRPVGFCCLGVLTDLAAKAGVCEWKFSDGVGGVTEYYSDNAGITYFNMAELPKSVMEWAGLKRSDPKVSFEFDDDIVSGKGASLGQLNDDFKFDFDQIADKIEEDL